MEFLIIKCVNLCLISLNIIFTCNVDAFNCSDLKIICAPRWGIEITPTPPPLCTALSLSRFDPVLLADLNTIKGTLPLMVIDHRHFVKEWADIVKRPVNQYVQQFLDVGVDVIAINMKTTDDDYKNPEFTQNIAKFFDDLKNVYPGMLFGLFLATDKNPIRNSIDFTVLNTHVHFYLLGFIIYRDCEFYYNGPVFPAYKEDIIKSINLFRQAGMDSNKLIYTIDLRIFTVKGQSEEDMAYSQVCSKEVSKYRKLCYQVIPDIFDKAHLCIQEKLLGIYIDNTDYDDFNASCNCLGSDEKPIAFKAITVIAGACCDEKADLRSFNCATFPEITRP